MFGLTFEKLFLVALIAGFVIGPQRLPLYAAKLGEYVRALRTSLENARTQAETEMGVPLQRADWEAMNLRQYDPRRIVRDALDSPTREPFRGPDAATDPPPPARPNAGPPPVQDAEVLAQAELVRPGQRYLVTGSAAHPRRVLIASLPQDDPRRVAAEREPDPVTRDESPHHPQSSAVDSTL